MRTNFKLRTELYEALLTICIALLAINAYLLFTQIDSWLRMVLSIGPALYATCLLVSIVVLVLLYLKKIGTTKRGKVAWPIATIILVTVGAGISIGIKDDATLLINNCSEIKSCVLISLMLTYGNVIASAGIAAISGNLIAAQFRG